MTARTGLQKVIVPENTGTIAISFWGDGSYSRQPVIAWVVTHGLDEDGFLYAEPIVCGQIGPMDWEYCLETQERGAPTSWIFMEDHTYDSLEEAINHGQDLAKRRRGSHEASAAPQ